MSDVPAAQGRHANRLLSALDAEALAHLERHLHPAMLRAGTVLYEPGVRIEHAYFPHNCIISLLAVLGDGQTAEVALFGCEGVAGYASSRISREACGRYLVQVPGTASRISLEQLRKAAEAVPTVRDILDRYSEALLRQTLQIVACNAVHTVEARCCRWLLSAHDRANDTSFALTHEFLAETLGVQRSTVSLITRTLQSAGLIEQHRGGITILDRQGLQSVACECYGHIKRTFEQLLPETFSRP
jgi:CRP-like cAMP-binding protein